MNNINKIKKSKNMLEDGIYMNILLQNFNVKTNFFKECIILLKNLIRIFGKKSQF